MNTTVQIRTLYTACLLIIAMFLVNCDRLLDINENPNAPTIGNPDYVLPGALVETARIQTRDIPDFASYWGGYYAASGSYSQSGDVVRSYEITSTSGICSNSWFSLYRNASNYHYIETSSQRSGYEYYRAVAKIMKVYIFQNLVDMYNNVPYKQAMEGLDNIYPSYDQGEDIYNDLSKQLDTAILLIKNAPQSAHEIPATADVMFSGDMTRWARLANTLHLRLCIHQSNLTEKRGQLTRTVKKIIDNKYGFLLSDALIQPGYTQATGLQNPFWEENGMSVGGTIGGRDYHRVSRFALNFYFSASDDRIYHAIRSIGVNPGLFGNNHFNGIDFGASPGSYNNSNNTSGFGPGLMQGPTQAVFFFLAAQSYFLQAEAVLLGFMSGDDKRLYERGVESSFASLRVQNSHHTATSYYSSQNNLSDYSTTTTTETKRSLIIQQKWIANFGIDGLEAWNDVRRTAMLKIPKSKDGSAPVAMPYDDINVPIRLMYPQSEYNTNYDNVSKEGTINPLSSKIFWMK